MTSAQDPTSSPIPATAEAEHWDRSWNGARAQTIDVDAMLATDDPIRHRFYEIVGDVRGKRVIDIGCGAGELTVLLAKRGANVTALDTSAEALRATHQLAALNGVTDRVRCHFGDLASTPTDVRFDLAVGIFVLHHIEPFDAFCDDVKARLDTAGRGVFLENNSLNPLLMFCRRFLVGRFGIPKYGDASEHPFEPREVDLLRSRFARVVVEFPQLIFVRTLNTYIFRHKPLFRPFCRLSDRIDDALFRIVPGLRKYSYNQVVSFGSVTGTVEPFSP